jgi:hypothetical protein
MGSNITISISIHNGPNKMLPLAYTPLAMANHTFVSLSSFGIFSMIGTFGEGYFQKEIMVSIHLPSTYRTMKTVSIIHMMRSPLWTAETILQTPQQETHDWFMTK